MRAKNGVEAITAARKRRRRDESSNNVENPQKMARAQGTALRRTLVVLERKILLKLMGMML
jgi:hypothetical protein